jgi:3-phosphoshikimate 1-carboxyvinyltransferase
MTRSDRPTSRQLPAELAIDPRGPLDAIVRVPGSKSITNRALLIAALASGETELAGALESDDTVVMRGALTALGATCDASGEPWTISGTSGRLVAPSADLDIGNSGTSARFLTAAACLADGPVVIDGNTRMRERPISDLTEALEALGGRLSIEGKAGCPPVRSHGGGLAGGVARIDASRSSQYVSAILLAAPYAQDSTTLYFVDQHIISRPYIDLTLEIMQSFGAEARWLGGIRDQGLTPAGALTEHSDEPGLYVRAGQGYVGRQFEIEPDASSAVYPLCAAAIAGGRVRVEGVPEISCQADFALIPMLERMGCHVMRSASGIEVSGPDDRLRSLGEVDMNHLPDAALAYAVVALFADGPTLIKNVGSLRIKETDRLAALETELGKLGARVSTDADSILIAPGPLQGAVIDTYDDHRMAMAFSLAGLRIPGIAIRDPACVSKTWPDYFDAFESL